MSIPHTVLCFNSMKPGVGKSTAAVLTAFELAAQGYRVGFVDGDRKSQTAREWIKGVRKRAEKTDADGNPMGTPLPFYDLSAAHEGIAEAANDELPEHDIRIYDLQGGDEAMVRAAAEDATDFIICTTMSKFDRAMVATAKASVTAGMLSHGRDHTSVTPWVLFGRVKVQRAVRQFNGTRAVSAEFQGYIDRYLKQDLAVFANWLPDRKAFEEIFKFHPADKGLDMLPVRRLTDEMKEEKIIRA